MGNTNGEEVAVQQIDPGPPTRPSLAFLASGTADDESTFHWDAIDRMVEVGYRYTLDSLKTWEDAGRPTPADQVAAV